MLGYYFSSISCFEWRSSTCDAQYHYWPVSHKQSAPSIAEAGQAAPCRPWSWLNFSHRYWASHTSFYSPLAYQNCFLVTESTAYWFRAVDLRKAPSAPYSLSCFLSPVGRDWRAHAVTGAISIGWWLVEGLVAWEASISRSMEWWSFQHHLYSPNLIHCHSFWGNLLWSSHCLPLFYFWALKTHG